MKKVVLILLLVLWKGLSVGAQELLTPIYRGIAPKQYRDTFQLLLPFFDDFSSYQGLPDAKLWLTDHAFINQDYDAFPPTVGMATLDALDAQGNLYGQESDGVFPADTLASQIIRLDSLFSPVKRRLEIADSICLSFYYLPGGGSGDQWDRIGDAPESSDSLFLDFFNPDSNHWITVWKIEGILVDSLVSYTGYRWQYVCIPILDASYLSERFQFRFRNYCSLDINPKPGMVGNCDQWNLDYIYLGTGRSVNDHYFRDVAFVNKPQTLIAPYQSVPFHHFSSTMMSEDMDLTIINLYSQPLATNYSYYVYDEKNILVNRYDGGYENAPVYYPEGNYQTIPAHANPPIDFVYPVSGKSKFHVLNIISEGATGDIHTCNDTLSYYQVFDNYYAYDDGVAENGYGLTSTSAKLYLAYRFDLPMEDTLVAIDICFNRTRGDENAQIPFNLCIWSNEGGCPGITLYKDPVQQFTEVGGINSYVRYKLTTPQLVNGSIFVGFEQANNAYINIGFDRNNDVSDRIYYRTATSWQRSILKGALMMRPCFGQFALSDISSPTPKDCEVTVYPNPAKDYITIERQEAFGESANVQIIDIKGTILREMPYSECLYVGDLSRGVYVLRIFPSNQSGFFATRIVLQ